MQSQNLPFVPPGDVRFDAAQISDVKEAAERTAAEGASLAQAAGFNARSAAAQGIPTQQPPFGSAGTVDS